MSCAYNFQWQRVGIDGYLHAHFLCICSINEEKTAENVVQIYLGGILIHKVEVCPY